MSKKDMRAALEEAFDLHDSGAVAAVPPEVESEPETIQAEGGADEPIAVAGETPVPEGETKTEEPETESPKAELSEEPPTPVEPPPASWKGDAKVHWDKIPEPVREEVRRRESQVNEALRASSESRKFQEEFEKTIQPYQAMIAADKVSPLQAMNTLFGTAAALRMGTPQQRATAVADIIHRFGVDIPILDSVLSGQGAPGAAAGDPNQAAIMRAIDERLAPVQQFMQGVQQDQQQTQQVQAQELEREIAEFASDPRYPYFSDFREDMADVLASAARRGQKMSLAQAYDRVAQFHGKGPSAPTPAGNGIKEETLERKKLAAASVRGVQTPPPEATKAPTTRRGAIEAAWEALEGGNT